MHHRSAMFGIGWGMAGFWYVYLFFYCIDTVQHFYNKESNTCLLNRLKFLSSSPGPALYLAGAGFPKVLIYFWPANIVGCFIADKVEIDFFQ